MFEQGKRDPAKNEPWEDARVSTASQERERERGKKQPGPKTVWVALLEPFVQSR